MNIENIYQIKSSSYNIIYIIDDRTYFIFSRDSNAQYNNRKILRLLIFEIGIRQSIYDVNMFWPQNNIINIMMTERVKRQHANAVRGLAGSFPRIARTVSANGGPVRRLRTPLVSLMPFKKQ